MSFSKRSTSVLGGGGMSKCSHSDKTLLYSSITSLNSRRRSFTEVRAFWAVRRISKDAML